MSVLDRLARLHPGSADPDERVARSVRFLGLSAGPATVLEAGSVAGAMVTVGVAAVALTLGPPARLAGLLCAVACGFGVAYAGRAVPVAAATARRTRTLSAAPDLVARAVLRMRIAPAAERAGRFAAATGTGPLAASLGQHVRRARATDATGLASFGAEWGAWFPSLERAAGLIETAGTVPPDDRERILDRALETVLDGMRRQARAYATAVRGPATALYAFGVLLPTALVALLPAARVAGLSVTPLAVVLVYDLAVPAAVIIGGAWLVARRPVAFPPPAITPAHPSVPERRWIAVGAGAIAAVAGWWLTGSVAPGWAPPIVAAGWGVGVALLLRFRPVVRAHERVRAAERELGDALAVIGRRVAAGGSAESAVGAAAGELDGPMGTLLARGNDRRRELGVGLRASFLGDGGAVERFPSRRLRAGLSVIALAAREGRPAGPALVALADHVESLRRVEQQARTELASVAGTLRSTGALFGPLVAGATVALAGAMAGGGFVGEELTWLGGVVGVYVLALAVVLPALSTALERGFDRAAVGVGVARALLLAPAVYVGAWFLVGGLT